VARTISNIVLHHSAVSGEGNQYEGVKAYHKKKWGRGMEYHFFVDKNAEVRNGMPEEKVGYHCGNAAMNVKSLGVCVAGDFTVETPTGAQIHSLSVLLMNLQARYGIPDENIVPHSSVKATSCPCYAFTEAFVVERVNIRKEQLNAAEEAKKKRKLTTLRKNTLTRLAERLRKLIGL